MPMKRPFSLTPRSSLSTMTTSKRYGHWEEMKRLSKFAQEQGSSGMMTRNDISRYSHTETNPLANHLSSLCWGHFCLGCSEASRLVHGSIFHLQPES